MAKFNGSGDIPENTEGVASDDRLLIYNKSTGLVEEVLEEDFLSGLGLGKFESTIDEIIGA